MAACETHECVKCAVFKNNTNFLTAEGRISKSTVIYTTFTNEDENTGGKGCWDKQSHRMHLS